MSKIKKIPIILDTDPGIDDAVAIAAALYHDEIDLQLITTVAGNVSVEQTTRNALQLLDFFKKSVPVAQGAYTPLARDLENAAHIHGHTGLDGYTFPTPKQQPIKLHAVEAMRQLLEKNEKTTLVPIGPLTNIALLFMMYPECKKKIDRIVLMGGSATRGNFMPNAEFNICIDPEAAHHVFNSGVPIVMCGLDITNKATVASDLAEKLLTLNETGKMLHALFQHYRGGDLKHGLKMHDLCTIAYLVKPSLFTTVETYVAVETQGTLTFGTTCVDLDNRFQKAPNTTVCMDIDVDAFREWFMEIISKAN